MLYRNEDNLKFSQAVTSRAGTYYLAKGKNGAIFGGLTFVKISKVYGE
jgi:hypothetical protein